MRTKSGLKDLRGDGGAIESRMYRSERKMERSRSAVRAGSCSSVTVGEFALTTGSGGGVGPAGPDQRP